MEWRAERLAIDDRIFIAVERVLVLFVPRRRAGAGIGLPSTSTAPFRPATSEVVRSVALARDQACIGRSGITRPYSCHLIAARRWAAT